MNYSIIRYVLGWVFTFQAILMSLPGLVAIIYKESDGMAFVAAILICLAFGLLMIRKKPVNSAFYMREGFVAVALSWILLSITGALPFIFSGWIPNIVDALCLKPFPALPPPAPASSPMWKACPSAFYFGEALPTGSAVWVSLYFSGALPIQEAIT